MKNLITAALVAALIASLFTLCPAAEDGDGLRMDADGQLRYYVGGAAVYAGVVADDEGNLYYINSTRAAVRSTVYDIGSQRANGLCAAGRYVADSRGVLTPLCGLYREADGSVRYYVDGSSVYAGLVFGSDGALYYFGSTGRAVCGRDYRPTKCNGIQLPTSLGCADGVLHFDEQGRAYFMESSGSRFYFIRSEESPLGYTVLERGW